ncbi:M43 family zinc metalloprotease [Reichenbachiella sp.]|uniref:M43 family zinc metalloprotease n=1 Tax=Reichenbachiella sp. TaxID=2184521 RepID=UPI003BB10FEC
MNSKLSFLPIILTMFFVSCLESDEIQEPNPTPILKDSVLHIPVIIHVVNYSPQPFEISDEKIRSQFEVLNEDFRMKNADTVNIPSNFKHLAADLKIEFHLATVDPNGEPTTGIVRNTSEISGWDGNSDLPKEEAHLYFSERGGQAAWPRDRYLNIWIANLSDRKGRMGLAGFANGPEAPEWKDGVVIDPRVFGTLPPLEHPQIHGRTATHEIGHWLGLIHIFGRDENCEEGDEVDDTPTAYAQYRGKPTHPQSSCGSDDMFMNFMDYVDDDMMCLFTKGQKNRVYEFFEEEGARRDLYLNLVKN